MGKAIDEKHLDIQEIEKLKINLALANTEIKKLKKDIEILKKAVNIDVKNININKFSTWFCAKVSVCVMEVKSLSTMKSNEIGAKKKCMNKISKISKIT